MRPLKIRRRIEKAVYDSGINVALYHVENSDWYKDFMRETQDAITSQIKEVVTVKNVDNLLLFTKKEKNIELITQVGALMTRIVELLGLADFLIKAGREGGQAFYDKTGITGSFLMKNPELISYLEDHSNLILDSVDETTKEWIASKLQGGRDRLLSPAEIVNEILEETDAFTRVRAETIVLTETANAMMVVEIKVAEEYGIKEIIWRTSIDDRVCEICLPLEGSKTNIGKAFPDGYFHPPAHPRCRCFIEEVIPREWNYGE